MLWYLLRQLKSNDESTRCSAVQHLAANDGPRAVAALVAALSDSAFTVRAEAAKALGPMRSPAAIKPLGAVLADDYGTVREAVVRALGSIGSAAVVGPLKAALSDEDAAVRRAAVHALTQMGAAEAREVLLEYHHREEEQRRLAEQARQARELLEEQKRLAEQAKQERLAEQVHARWKTVATLAVEALNGSWQEGTGLLEDWDLKAFYSEIKYSEITTTCGPLDFSSFKALLTQAAADWVAADPVNLALRQIVSGYRTKNERAFQQGIEGIRCVPDGRGIRKLVESFQRQGNKERLVVFNEQFLGRDRQALRRALAQLGCRDILYDWKKGDRSGLAYPSEFIEDFLGGSPAAVVLVRESDKNALTAIDNWMPVRHNNRPHEGYVLEFINKVVADPANFRSVMILVQMDSVLDLVDKKRQFICMLLEMLRLHSEYIGVEDLRAAAGMTSTTATNVTLWPSEDSPASFSSVTIDLSRIAKAATAELNRRGL